MTKQYISARERFGTRTPAFGIATYLGSATTIEIAGNWGLDFVVIDAEHTATGIDRDMEKLVMAALVGGIAPFVRTRGTVEWEIRKVLEFGAAGVLIPQVHTADQMQAIVNAARFYPTGRRGIDASVRAASYGGPDFTWKGYLKRSRETLLIPTAESVQFFENIDEILAVDGIDVVMFGPVDYAISRQIPTDDLMAHPEILARVEELVLKCHARGTKVMVPGLPATDGGVAMLLSMGVDMVILGTDILFMNQGCQRAIQAMKAANASITGSTGY
jgi:4-hydroxy-2-oxoheptanedioate aldolase